MVRATTGGVLKSYRYNLMNSFISSNKARNTVLTQRVFNSYAEDPAAAAKTFRLRKSRMMANSQLDVCQGTYSKHSTGFSCLLAIDELIDTANGKGTSMTTLKSTTLEMLNDPKGDARVQLNKVLDQMSDTIIQNLNQTYGDEFIFAGADGHNVPFTVEEVDGHKKLLYRGVPVDAQMPELMMDADGKTELEVKKSDGTDIADEPTYLREGTELIEASSIRALEPDVDGTPPITVHGTDGNVYYVLQGGKSSSEDDLRAELAAKGLVGDELEAELEKKKAECVEFSVFVPPLPENTVGYYKKENLILKDEYDKIDNSILRDKDGNPYVVVTSDVDKDGKVIGTKENYIVKGRDDAFITKSEYEKACKDAEKLDYLMKEKRFVDIGLGFQEDENGKLIESSAFNEALNGLTFLGYGMDEDGDPKNIYSIVQRLKEIAANAPNEGQWSEETYEEFRGLVLKLEDASSKFKTEFTNMDAGTQKLKNNVDLLTEKVYNLKEQYSELEDVNMADAITSFIWAEYCYNAALKVGNSILSQSLMDYLN